MQVKPGDTATLRDGRVVVVSDAADQDPDAWRLYDEAYYERTGQFRIKHQYVPETIFVGTLVGTQRTVVSDMSEVVAVAE